MAHSEGEGKVYGTVAKYPAHPPSTGVSLGKEWGAKGSGAKGSDGKGPAHPPSIGVSLGKEWGAKGSSAKGSDGKGYNQPQRPPTPPPPPQPKADDEGEQTAILRKTRAKRVAKHEAKNIKTCRECGTQDHWRHMEGRRLQEETVPEEELQRRGTSAEAMDIRVAEAEAVRPQYQYDHLCVECVAWRDNLSVPMAARHIAGKKAASTMKRAADFKQAMDNPQESIAVVMGYNSQAEGTVHARSAHPGAVDESKVIPDGELSWEEVQNRAAERLAELRTLSKKQYREEMKKIVVHSFEILKEVHAPIVELITLKKTDMEEAKHVAEAFGNFLAGGDDHEDHEPVQREGAELGQTLKKAT